VSLIKTITMAIIADPGDTLTVLGDASREGDKLREPITMVLTADGEEAAAGVDEVTEALSKYIDTALKAQETAGRLAEVQADDSATAEDYTEALDANTKATLRQIDAQVKLTEAEARAGEVAQDAGDAEVEAGTKADAAGDEAEAAGEKWKLGSMAMFGIAAALGAVAYESVKTSIDFQRSMELLVTEAGVPQKSLGALKTGVLQVAGAVGEGPGSLAESLYHIESAFKSTGITSAQALNLMKTGAEEAQIGQAPLVDTQNALDAAVVAGIPGIRSYSQAAGAMLSIVGSGDMTMSDLAAAMGSGAIAVAKTYGQSIYQVGAALAVFGDNNIRGAKAATDLRMSWQAMLDPIETGAADLKQLGLTTTELGNTMTHHGLSAAVGEFIAHLKSSHTPMKDWGQMETDIFGKKAGVGIGLLVSQYDRLRSKFPQLEKGAHDFGSAWGKTKQTVGVELDRLGASAQTLGIKIGNDVLPPVQKLFGFLASHSSAAIKVAGAIGILTAALVLFTATTKIAGAAMDVLDVEMDANPIGLVVVAIAALVVGMIELYKHVKLVREAVSEMAHLFKAGWHMAMEAAGAVIKWFTGGPLAWIKQQLGVFSQFWAQHGEEIKKIWHAAWDIISAYVHVVWGLVSTYLKSGMDVLVGVFGAGWDIISGLIKMAWDVISTIVSTGIHVVLDIIGAVLDVIQGHWAAAGRSLQNATMAIWHGVVRIITTVTDGFGRMLVSAGKALISGLISGIKSATGGLLSTISGLAKDVSGAFSSVLHILSPSRVFYEHGQMIVEGLRLGISDSAPRAIQAADRLASMVSAGAAGGYSGSGGGGRGGGDTYNFYVAPLTDPDKTAREIQQMLLRLKRNRGQTGLGLA
jgi:TP901 family phage tail tape measure protein